MSEDQGVRRSTLQEVQEKARRGVPLRDYEFNMLTGWPRRQTAEEAERRKDLTRKLSFALMAAQESPTDENIAKIRAAAAARLAGLGSDEKGLNAKAEEMIGVLLGLRADDEAAAAAAAPAAPAAPPAPPAAPAAPPQRLCAAAQARGERCPGYVICFTCMSEEEIARCAGSQWR